MGFHQQTVHHGKWNTAYITPSFLRKALTLFPDYANQQKKFRDALNCEKNLSEISFYIVKFKTSSFTYLQQIINFHESSPRPSSVSDNHTRCWWNICLGIYRFYHSDHLLCKVNVNQPPSPRCPSALLCFADHIRDDDDDDDDVCACVFALARLDPLAPIGSSFIHAWFGV